MRISDERGTAVVVALVMIALLMTVAVIAGGVGALIAAHRTAQAAADLAALAAATDIQSGRDGCAGASRVAGANGAQVQVCEVHGSEVTVTVVVRAPGLLGRRELRARARAGPGLGDAF